MCWVNTEELLKECDVVVVGGGTAGLSGALTLARARRSVLVLDTGQPRNAPADAAHGLLSCDGVSPRDLLRAGRIEVAFYGGTLLQEGATSACRTDGGFVVGTRSGRTFRARRLLVTTGLVDELPGEPGLLARWGRDVLHCPYCHGWEVRDRTIGVLGTSAASVHQALLFHQWSPRVTLFLHSGPEPSEGQWERLAARGIEVVQGEVSGLEVTDDALSGARLASGQRVPVGALVVAPRFVARSEILSGLGVGPVEHPMGVDTCIPAEPGGATEAPGVYVAGHVTDPMGGPCGGAGVRCGGGCGGQRRPGERRRRRGSGPPPVRPGFSAADEAIVCERGLGDRRHGLDSILPPNPAGNGRACPGCAGVRRWGGREGGRVRPACRR